jgi:hypothetical protein
MPPRVRESIHLLSQPCVKASTCQGENWGVINRPIGVGRPSDVEDGEWNASDGHQRIREVLFTRRRPQGMGQGEECARVRSEARTSEILPFHITAQPRQEGKAPSVCSTRPACPTYAPPVARPTRRDKVATHVGGVKKSGVSCWRTQTTKKRRTPRGPAGVRLPQGMGWTYRILSVVVSRRSSHAAFVEADRSATVRHCRDVRSTGRPPTS